MSAIAIGATMAVGATVTAGTVAAGATLAAAGVGAYTAYKGSKSQAAALRAGANGMQLDPAALAAILAEIEGYAPVNVGAVASKQAEQNAGRGVTLARQSASRLNTTATNDTVKAMNTMYGGKDAYNELRQRALDDIADNMDGQVSRSTRQQIGRKLLGSGVSELGEGAVADNMTGYLGLTAEGLSAQGQEQFKSLYQTWRQAVPLINGAQILDRFTMTPDNAVQAEIANATAAAQSELAIAGLEMQALGMGYQANMNVTQMNMDGDAAMANGRSQMAGQIASGVGQVAGSYSAKQTAQPVINSGVSTSRTGVAYNSSTGQPIPRAQVVA